MKTKITFIAGFALLVTSLVTLNALYAVGALAIGTVYGIGGAVSDFRKQ